MAIRPIDIARKLKISTTTLRTYEELGLIPPVIRSESGYRVYTDEHLAYFICIREMLPGFSMSLISKILKEMIAQNINAALWIANKAQADLHQEKIVSEKIRLNFLEKQEVPVTTKHKLLTINEVSAETGVPATTIRYWDKVGLLSVERATGNNYRLFTNEHIRQILTIYALKFSVYSSDQQYSVERVREELKEFDYTNTNRIRTIANDLEQHLDKANRDQIKAIAALYHLCTQVETRKFDE